MILIVAIVVLKFIFINCAVLDCDVINKLLFFKELLNYPDDHPDKNELLRKYGTIYGRFDSKRKSDKMMNWHEVRLLNCFLVYCTDFLAFYPENMWCHKLKHMHENNVLSSNNLLTVM